MSDYIAMTAVIEARTGCAEALEKQLPEFEKVTNDEPGCVEFRFFKAAEKPNQFILWEIFTSQESLATHTNADYTKDLFALDLIQSTQVIKHSKVI